MNFVKIKTETVKVKMIKNEEKLMRKIKIIMIATVMIITIIMIIMIIKIWSHIKL